MIGESSVMSVILSVKDQIDEIKTREKRGRKLDVIHHGQLWIIL